LRHNWPHSETHLESTSDGRKETNKDTTCLLEKI
jgi:hypothetical protein